QQMLYPSLNYLEKQNVHNNQQGQLQKIDHQDDLDEKIPPDFNQAQKHFLANQVGMEKDIDQLQNIEYCVCCARQIQKNKLNLNCDLEKLSFLGSGFPSYFVYIKQCGILLLFLLGISGIFNVASNILGSQKCQKSRQAQPTRVVCQESNWVSVSSLGSKSDQQYFMEIQGYLNLVSLLGIIVLLQFFRKYQRELEIKCDQEDISANDYTIMVSNIPIEYDAINNDYDEDLMHFFQENSFPERKVKVEQVTLCYNLQELTQLDQQKQKLILQKQKKIQESQNALKQINNAFDLNQPYYKDIQADILKINAQIKEQNYKIDKLTLVLMDGKGKQLMKQYFTGIAFVTFAFEQDKEDIIEKYQQLSLIQNLFYGQQNQQLIYKGNQLRIRQAPNPSDVFWSNLHMSKRDKQKRKILGFLVETFILIFCSCTIYAFYHLQQQEANKDQNQQSLKLQILTISLAIVISVINFLLFEVLKYLADYQKYKTRTLNKIEISKGLSVSRFINSCIISFIICIFIQYGDKQKKLFGESGLAINGNNFMISNCITPFMIQALNFDFIRLSILRKIEAKKQNQSVLTQQQLNTMFENSQFPIEERYSQILVTMFTTAFYAPILPTSIMWSCLALFLQYWVDKYDLLNRSTVKYNMSITLSIEMTEHLEYFLSIYSVSTLIFYYYINGESWSQVSIIGAVIGIAHAWLPMQLINQKIFKVNAAEPNIIDYQEAQKYFITDYCRENPIYKRQAQKDYVKRMKERIIQKNKIENHFKVKIFQQQNHLLIFYFDFMQKFLYKMIGKKEKIRILIIKFQ
ncbi:phage head-tail family protein, putative, partial [Ichthyophthirius multifiliis]